MAISKNIALDTWDELVAAITRLRDEDLALRAKQPRASHLMFRGQRDATWKLETTLERYAPASLSLNHYYSAIWAAKSEIEAYTGLKWELEEPPYKLYEKLIEPDSSFLLQFNQHAYDYMVYLRHHGFPSPLLDWTQSPFVAAFFAFQESGDSPDRAAIFAYRESATGVKGGLGPRVPTIGVRGPYVRAHRRHFIQQCQYTVCLVFKPGGGPPPEWHYTAHDDVFAPTRPTTVPFPDQDQLWKFTLPRSERKRVLAYLDEHNLNAYSLFGSEEALMETMAWRHLP